MGERPGLIGCKVLAVQVGGGGYGREDKPASVLLIGARTIPT